MGRNDAVSKNYLSKDDVFADAINYHFFGGQQVVRPEDLREQDPEELALLFGKKGDGAGGDQRRGRDQRKGRGGEKSRGREKGPALEQR